MALVFKCFEVYLINLGPAVGSEIKKICPCLIISCNKMNRHISTIIVAPIKTGGSAYSTVQDPVVMTETNHGQSYHLKAVSSQDDVSNSAVLR